jgi:hypothetical protein
MVVYVTKQGPVADPDIRGKITGFYHVSHITGHRDEFTAPEHHGRDPEKWQYSLKAIRAFSFLPEYRLDIDTFDPTIRDRARGGTIWRRSLCGRGRKPDGCPLR